MICFIMELHLLSNILYSKKISLYPMIIFNIQAVSRVYILIAFFLFSLPISFFVSQLFPEHLLVLSFCPFCAKYFDYFCCLFGISKLILCLFNFLCDFFFCVSLYTDGRDLQDHWTK